MSFMAVNFDCCVSTGSGGDATAANQATILAQLAALKVCADAIQEDVTDVQTGVDNLETTVINPEAC